MDSNSLLWFAYAPPINEVSWLFSRRRCHESASNRAMQDNYTLEFVDESIIVTEMKETMTSLHFPFQDLLNAHTHSVSSHCCLRRD